MRKLGMEELGRITPEAFKDSTKTPVVLVLDNIRSGLNVGAAFRTADAFALEEIKLCGITAQPPHREILKTAIGATESVLWTYFQQVEEALQELKEAGYTLLAIEQTDSSTPLQRFTVNKEAKYALVLGNEVHGVSNQALELVEGALEIPQMGTKHSLNIAVCTGIVSWYFFQHFRL